MRFALILQVALSIVSNGAFAWGLKQPITNPLHLPFPPYTIPRLERLNVMTVAAGGQVQNWNGQLMWGPTDKVGPVSQFVHHDGDTFVFSAEFLDYDNQARGDLQVLFRADANSSGSLPAHYRLTSGSTNALISDVACNAGDVYCSVVIEHVRDDVFGNSGSSLPNGKYNLAVTYADGSFAVHTLVLSGYGPTEGFAGFVQ